MHPALWKLYRLRIHGGLRSMARKIKSVRGAALAIFTVLVLLMMIGPNLTAAFMIGRTPEIEENGRWLGEWAPVAMALYVVLSIVTSLGERAVYFSPSDVDFLFPAPFSRRQILLYKVLGSVTAAVFIAMFLSLSMAMHVRSLPAAALGFFLAWLMIHSLTLCAQLVAQSVTERAFTRARKLLLAGVIAAAAAALGQAAARGLNGPWRETLIEARHSLVAEILLSPFVVFARIITAERFVPDGLGWAALGAAIVVGIYALAIRLDANYLETAARVSRQMEERRRRIASGGVFAARSARAVRSSRLPQPPWLGGIGPLVWRQVVQSLRSSRGAMMLGAIALAAIAVSFALGVREDLELPDILPHMVIGIVAYATFLFSAQAPVGFRGDYERLDLLKSLPIRPAAMACGQTIAAAALLTLVQWLVFAGTAVFAPAATAELLIAGLFALHFNWLLFGMDNFFFLLYPSPLVATGSEGFLKMGRLMLLMLAKLLVLAACSAVAAVPAAVVYLATDSIPAALLAAWLAFLLPAMGILLLIAWGFQRYEGGAVAAE